MWQEVQARGFTGSWMMVYRWVQLQEEVAPGEPSQPARQTKGSPRRVAPRHLAWLLVREVERLDEGEQHMLGFIRQHQQVNLAYE